MKKYVNNIIDNWILNKIKRFYGLCFKWEIGEELYPLFKRSKLKLEDLDEEIQEYIKEYLNYIKDKKNDRN